MKSESNNGYLRSGVITEESEFMPAAAREIQHTGMPLQVTCSTRGNTGTTTTVIHRPGNSSRMPGITRATSITRRRGGPTNRQQLIGVLTVTLLVTSLFTLMLLALHRNRECAKETLKFIYWTYAGSTRQDLFESRLSTQLIWLTLTRSTSLPCKFLAEKCLNVCLTEECVRTASSLLAAMDRTASPCVDFFQYACGTWNRLHIIPEDRSSINTFEVLSDQLKVILKRVLEEPPNKQDNSATLKAKTFYKSCMDIPQIRHIGDAPLKETLRNLGGWPVVEGTNWEPPKNLSIEILLGRIRGEFNEGVLVEHWVGPDDKNSSANILQVRRQKIWVDC
ncbi:hypothetical protein KQX54_004370 [Cotesia glomerata]|uniref:Peptidase M13 N-terminal domain-containing protein n=1 Tax=Cotesia glomerata TaxID=32391 RepID=A0AAV7I1P7_COTGL|nr:hypothetical protein KQX54_004370 [Cotesia glomerata]